ncbi:response regulator [Paenibacillus qinlingensis]|uniref:Two-component system response regulator YesN n=1 Tax=Paenibacillus qinlingensis TaxID=1837343 RepID=A0ABU1NUM8_9BACL|nr:response regulator [Paenibacillus qinlingensis]MDR6550537.1 two-component system response regulator YesN [Paenibacillus qinlingensis]
MLKVLIVDDEMLVRVGMKSLISWENHGFEIIGDAGDGEKALEIMDKQLPDIVLTDILMPNMNGLELIGRVKKRSEHIRVVVLSSHSDYDYVREAMKLGADDYILKASVKPTELLSLLQELAESIHQEHKLIMNRLESTTDSKSGTLEDRTQSYLRLLCESELTDEQFADYYNRLHWEEASGSQMALLLRNHPMDAFNKDQDQLLKSLTYLAEQQLSPLGRIDSVRYKNNELAIFLLNMDLHREPLIEEHVQDLIIAAKRFLNITISAGRSRLFQGIGGLLTAFIEAKEASKYSFYQDTGGNYGYQSDYFSRRSTTGFPYAIKIGVDLEQTIQRCDTDKLDQWLSGLFMDLQTKRYEISIVLDIYMDVYHQLKTIGNGLELDWSAIDTTHSPLFEQVLHLETLQDMEIRVRQLATSLIEASERKRKGTYREEIHYLIDYMQQHYASNITLSSAAKLVNMSESYISHLFKKETDISFIEFLTTVRMNKAAEYLHSTHLPSYLIAEKVGYDNINYFGRAFKKVMGVSPSEYREHGAKTFQ